MQPHETNPATMAPSHVSHPNDVTLKPFSPPTSAGGSTLDHQPIPVLTEQGGHTPVHARPGMGLWMLAFAALLAFGLGSGFFIVNHQRSAAESALHDQTVEAADAPLSVDVARVQYASGTRLVLLPGECRAWFETTIYARVNGYVKKWFVDIGDHVKQGDVLATIETPELDQQLTADQAKVEAGRAQVKLAEANVHYAEVTLARFKDAPKGVVSDIERDQKEADYQTSQARLTAAQSDLNSAQADVDRLRAMIAFQKVIAPFDGVITQRRVDIGDLVTAGSTANTTPLFRLAQSDEMRVFVNVPESATPDIYEGAEAIATADEFPGRQFVGHVARTSRAIDDAFKTLRVEVDIPNKDATLLPGMFVRVNFQVKARQPLLVIPASAINFRSGGPQVATVAQDGRVAFNDVAIARDLGDAIEIKSGLKLDDRVILNISNQILAGDIVKPNEAASPGSPSQPPKPVQASVDDAKPGTLNLD